ncbi:BTB/POZ and MATH domain-containing protein 2-like [Miscanthus floridulus]|uniref:BTB/POZ and MATH domain-containing protein 2-like n=1 Tax=Miscanthus floridulus TaxID=154761 RepID=UPI003459B176
MGKHRLVETSTSSSSRCVTASVHAVHSFEVTSFSLLEGMGAGIFVSSRTFRAGGRGWNIRVYPDGWKEEDKAEYVSAFLCLVDGPKDAKTRTKYTLELLQKDGKVSELTRCSAVMLSHTFEAVDSYWGLGKFVDKSKLKPLLRLNVDCFTVRCALTIIGESQSEDVAAPSVVVEEFPQPNMHQHLEHMLKTGKDTDVTFDVDGQIFHAHRCVLAARSAVFESELLGPMKEKAIEEPIKVADMEPSIFEDLLHFIYTDSISDSNNDVHDKNMFMQHLLVAADRYGLDRLRLMCEVSLCHGIDAQTVATTLALAEQHHCARLKDACLKFVASRRDVLGVVMKTDGFKHLMASCPLIVVEILDKIAEA